MLDRSDGHLTPSKCSGLLGMQRGRSYGSNGISNHWDCEVEVSYYSPAIYIPHSLLILT